MVISPGQRALLSWVTRQSQNFLLASVQEPADVDLLTGWGCDGCTCDARTTRLCGAARAAVKGPLRRRVVPDRAALLASVEEVAANAMFAAGAKVFRCVVIHGRGGVCVSLQRACKRDRVISVWLQILIAIQSTACTLRRTVCE